MDPRHLREATRAEHEATEALMPLMGPELTKELYVEVLRTLYPLLKGWEAWAGAVASPELRPMLERRRRSHLLQADLTSLGAAMDERVHACVDWDAVVTGAEEETGVGRPEAKAFEAGFWGTVYVMEGSTLGGRYIARHLEAKLGLRRGDGDAYFQGHGEATGAMWREVLEHVAAVPGELVPWVIGAARRTFGVFGAALRTRRAVAEKGTALTLAPLKASNGR